MQNRLNRPPAGVLLPSAAAADVLGVGVTAVKRWADAGLLPCVKTAGGHRRFRRADLALRLQPASGAAVDPWQEWIGALVDGADVHGVLALLFRERARRGSWHDVATVVGELLVAIGERWARGEMTVAQEHLASGSLQRALALTAETVLVSSAAPRCVLAAADGDDHTLGLSLAELCLREQGWRTESLGRATRTIDVAERITGHVQMVALSASAFMHDRRALRTQVRTVGSACQRAGIPLILGGSGRWPDPPAFGTRLYSWIEVHRFMQRHRVLESGRAIPMR